jgi:pilus assembly protein CpaB
MKRKMVLLIASALIALAGVGLVMTYVSGVSSKATADEALVKVLTATSVINAGETATQAQSEGKFALTAIPKSTVVVGAVTSVDTMGDQVALAPIYPGEQILALKFGTTAAAATAESLPVPKGMIAISVELSDPGRVAGFVTPGLHVAIFVTYQNPSADAAAQPSYTRILVPSAEVLAVGPTTLTTPPDETTDSTATDAVPQTILTVALVQHDSDRVLFASNNDKLAFGLIGKGTRITRDPGVTQADLLK